MNVPTARSQSGESSVGHETLNCLAFVMRLLPLASPSTPIATVGAQPPPGA